mmetsp:Transcript_7225/g.13590  ORF Transcript_7225/g.13590 Transcript_7225/m.13590 type:complete len:208 (+) Transcript_7225:351-974(+)
MDIRTSRGTLSPRSAKFSAVCESKACAEYLNSRFSLACSSTSKFASTSSKIFSTSSSLSFDASSMVMDCCCRVAQSLADTVRIPSMLMSNVTSIFGTPAGAGGMPRSLNLPSLLLSLASGRSPWRTTTSISSWASPEVVKMRTALNGTEVFFSITGVKTPPFVSTPRVRGVTSISMMSWTSPATIAACTAAPSATASSGLIALFTGL